MIDIDWDDDTSGSSRLPKGSSTGSTRASSASTPPGSTVALSPRRSRSTTTATAGSTTSVRCRTRGAAVSPPPSRPTSCTRRRRAGAPPPACRRPRWRSGCTSPSGSGTSARSTSTCARASAGTRHRTLRDRAARDRSGAGDRDARGCRAARDHRRNGARPSRRAVLALADRIDAPVITTFTAEGLVPDGHPLACGVLGRWGTPVGSAVMARSDCLLVLGASFSDKKRQGDGRRGPATSARRPRQSVGTPRTSTRSRCPSRHPMARTPVPR